MSFILYVELINNMKNEEVLVKEIDLIQSCINRMAQNSFIIKGWTISLNGILLGVLADKGYTKSIPIICMISIICFWYLDAFFLRTEKLYRWKYEWIINNRVNSNKYLYDLNPYNKDMWTKEPSGRNKRLQCVFRIMFTKTLWPMYILLLVINVYIIIRAVI